MQRQPRLNKMFTTTQSLHSDCFVSRVENRDFSYSLSHEDARVICRVSSPWLVPSLMLGDSENPLNIA